MSSPAILKAPLCACCWKNVIYSLTHSLSTFIVPFDSTKSGPSIFKDEMKAFEEESKPNPATPNSVTALLDISASFSKVKSSKSSKV